MLLFMARFKIYAAKTEDVSQGWVRLGGLKLPHRSVVKLKASDTGKSVYCEVLSIDDNFIDDYNRPGGGRIAIKDAQQYVLVAAEWYRTHLGLKTGDEAEIEVTIDNGFCGRVHACLHHPQVVVRVATYLGILGVALGALAVVLALIPFFQK